MSLTATGRIRDHIYWGLAAASAAPGYLLLTLGGPDAFHTGVAALAVIAATSMAIGDRRTSLLRNAWTGPFAAAAVLQLVLATSALPDELGLMAIADLALLVNAGAYTAMGLIGWVGFGDLKFMVGLTLFAALVAGSAAMLITPVALLVAAATRATSLHSPQSSRPHGPALAVAFALILGTARVFHLAI